MELKNIRNFCIIAHIDHGKSTLADRMLELTNTIEKRKMRAQVLDQMELERERGITIKMQPVRMSYSLHSTFYILNLIDTPGHIDFSYEVSRALKAVEGAILLVDATQGVQAQTIANVEMAKALGLKIIPVINKIDLLSARVEETNDEIKRLLGSGGFDEILNVSAKTGEGVARLLEEVIRRVPPPKAEFADRPRALIFDFEYSLHQGVIVYIRMIDGLIRKGDELLLSATKEKFVVGEVGIFSPARVQSDSLSAGEIGYVITNIKKPSIATVGDTVVSFKNPLPPLGGYMHPRPVVWASVYPESQDDFDFFRQALERLRLSDSSLIYEEEASGALGRGFRCGFLGMLHLEIIIERLKREFGLGLIVAAPTITYKIQLNNGEEKEIYSPMFFPDQSLIKKLYEPWVEAQIIAPIEKTGAVVQILYEHEAEVGGTEPFGGNRNMMNVKMPLRELMRNFFDELKSATSGYGSLNYKVAETREIEPGRIVRLDVLVAEELVTAFSRIVSREKVQREAEDIAEKLKNLIPRELFTVKIQAKALGRILASRSIPALKKDVTGYLYGGDRTRKMKLWQKQKRGKERLKKAGRVNIPHEVFVKVMQNK
jgi:GTP-binding protein LepA